MYTLLFYESNSKNIAYEIQLILIICEFYIYKFAYSLKFISNPKINTCGPFKVICDKLCPQADLSLLQEPTGSKTRYLPLTRPVTPHPTKGATQLLVFFNIGK